MRIHATLSHTTAALALMAVFATAAPAHAQEAGDSDKLTDIIVTAQKREQRLQDVPVVVTVVGAALLEDAGIKDIKDLTVLTPGMTVTSSS